MQYSGFIGEVSSGATLTPSSTQSSVLPPSAPVHQLSFIHPDVDLDAVSLYLTQVIQRHNAELLALRAGIVRAVTAEPPSSFTLPFRY